eukprot:scaffold436828_cov47-Prasinocladus_malaysianus.AAC.2
MKDSIDLEGRKHSGVSPACHNWHQRRRSSRPLGPRGPPEQICPSWPPLSSSRPVLESGQRQA